MDNKEGIKELFKQLEAVKKEEIDLQYDVKTLESDIKSDYASELGLFKKDGTTLDLAKVKMPVLKTAIKIAVEDEPNKLEEKYELQEEYISDVTNHKVSKDLITSLLSKEDAIKDIKQDYKAIKDEQVGILDADEVKAVEELVKLTTKAYKADCDDKWKEDQGLEVKSKAFDDGSMNDLIQKIAKELDISL